MTSIFPLVLNKATVIRRGKRLLGPIDLTINPGEFSIVMGPNGSGKTTLLRMMHGLERVSSGSVCWNQSIPEVRKKQSYVFQTPIMLRRTVKENLAYPLVLNGMKRKDAYLLAKTWAYRIKLEALFDRPATRLSGGEKQKLALARALIKRPDVLFLDEPCANLDGRATREIEELLKSTHNEGTRIIMATHDMGQAKRLASEVIMMIGGRIREYSTADQFFGGPQTREARAFLSGDIIE